MLRSSLEATKRLDIHDKRKIEYSISSFVERLVHGRLQVRHRDGTLWDPTLRLDGEDNESREVQGREGRDRRTPTGEIVEGCMRRG